MKSKLELLALAEEVREKNKTRLIDSLEKLIINALADGYHSCNMHISKEQYDSLEPILVSKGFTIKFMEGSRATSPKIWIQL